MVNDRGLWAIRPLAADEGADVLAHLVSPCLPAMSGCFKTHIS